MLDASLRPVKDRLLAPFARHLGERVPPVAISSIGLVVGLAAAGAAWQSRPVLAVVLFLVGRVADGLDGLVARERRSSSDVGGLVDFVFDTIVYAAIPLGIAAGIDERTTWIATAVLLATFYLNAVSLGYVAALLEKRALGATGGRRVTSATLPRGLVEGTETILLFTLALAAPRLATTVWWIMATAVLITALERVRWASQVLR